MNPNDTFSLPANVAARRVGEETVILDLDSGNYFSLDDIGTRIWELLAEGNALGQICSAVLEEYEVDRPQLEQDIADLTQNLLDQGLVVRS